MRSLCWSVALSIMVGLPHAAAQELQIGIIDFYGLSQVSESAARQALTFKEGDTVPFPNDDHPAFVESEKRLSMLPGAAKARAQVICCDQGRAIVYVGIEERGSATMTFRAAPSGRARLAIDIVRADDELSNALLNAFQRGDAGGEDQSHGHALAEDATMRAIQTRFISYARRDLNHLRLVLRTSSDAAHRALAAQVIGYAADKQSVVNDLVYGMSDPSEDVRNNAMRALLLFAKMTPAKGRRVPHIPYQPFVALLNSPIWTDRNKASGALAALSATRDPHLLASLRKDSLGPLVEMARWKYEGHAMFAFSILARIAGISEDEAMAAWSGGEREAIINAALPHR